MSLFSSSFAPSSAVVTGTPAISNPFSVDSPSNQDKKRKRPRESDATRSSALPTTSSNSSHNTPSKKPNTSHAGNGNAAGGGGKTNGGAAPNAYAKRNTVVAAQANLEKLMKKVGMTGEIPSSPSSHSNATHHAHSGNNNANANTRPAKRDRHSKLIEDDPSKTAFSDEEKEEETPVKKRKVKHGLDGRPTGAAAKKDDPLAGLMGGKKDKKKGDQKDDRDKAGGKKVQQKQQPQGTPVKKPSTVALPAVPAEEIPAKDGIGETIDFNADIINISSPPPTESAGPADLAEPTPPAPTTLTHLQNSLTSKLSSAKFRWLNEQLYTTPSGKAWELMRSEGGRAFDDYHNAHRQQTSAWPSPPLPFILRHILSRLSSGTLPVGSFIIDLGCGDAELARDLMSSTEGREKGVKVASYDLVGNVDWVDSGITKSAPQEPEVKNDVTAKGRGWVIPTDFLSSIPLPGNPGGSDLPTSAPEPPSLSKAAKRRNKNKGGSDLPPVGPEVVDVAVCCLSLMGINWVGGVYEVARVLKEGGIYYVAEVTSRLVDKPGFIALICSFGFELVEHKSPTTHFDLFEFRKTSAFPLGKVKGQEGWLERVKRGEKVMKGCVYKKR